MIWCPRARQAHHETGLHAVLRPVPTGVQGAVDPEEDEMGQATKPERCGSTSYFPAANEHIRD